MALRVKSSKILVRLKPEVILLNLEFHDIRLDEAQHYLSRWNMCTQRTSDYCFPVIWSLGPDYGTKIAYDEANDLYWLHQRREGLNDLAPVGRWERGDWPAILKDRYGEEFEIDLVPEALADIWRRELAGAAEIEITDDRGTWEYLYDIRALASLSGNKYMKKRNRVNQFRKNYDYSYEPLTKAIIGEISSFQQSWCQANNFVEYPGLIEENRAIHRILDNWSKIPNLCGGAIRVGKKIEAYTIGELAGNMLVVHYEKASLEYGAAYQVINKEFLTHVTAEHPELEIVNREEDMNDAGLRAAKLSYLPTGFLKECRVNVKFI